MVAKAQQFTLSGKVSDQDGNAIELATISCLEQGAVTMANLKGEYSLKLQSKDSVVIRFSMVQTFVAGICAAPFVLLPSEASRLTLAHFRAGWFSLFYVSIMSSGIAYTMQNLGQARTNASVAAVLMSFESVVGAVSGWLALGDAFTPAQTAGCALVFSAVVIAQLFSPRRQGD